jgi:hypothetical protein
VGVELGDVLGALEGQAAGQRREQHAAEGVHVADRVRLLDGRRQTGFAAEALEIVGVACQRGSNDLDRDPPAELGLLGEVHHAHAPLPSTPSIRYPAKIVPILIAAAIAPTRA